MTRTTPLRLMILQWRHIFFTEASTFISSSIQLLISTDQPEHPRRRYQAQKHAFIFQLEFESAANFNWVNLLRNDGALAGRFPLLVKSRRTSKHPALEIRLLEQRLVLMRHDVSLNLCHEIHRHNYDDEQRGSAEIKWNVPFQYQKLG